MDPTALSQLSKQELIALLEAQEARHRSELAAQEERHQAAMKAMLERIAELERRLGLNSANSSKPPSSDGPRKPPRVSSLRERTGRKPGGQKGHPGKTLCRSTTPDAVVDHYPGSCGTCGAALSAETASGYAARQVFDLPEPQPLVVTEHRAHDCQCGVCGARTRAAFPEGVSAPVQYGQRIAAFVIYLLHAQLLPEDRLATLMMDLFSVPLCAATIARISRDCATRFGGFVAAVRDHVADAAVKHLDETGFRIGGKTQWLHVAATTLLTFYRVAAKRGSLPERMAGVIVHDFWRPYYTLKGVLHSLCGAHLLRELKALIEIEQEDWARQMQRLLRRACHAVNLARERNIALNPSLISLIERRYDTIVTQGTTFHEAQPPLASKRRRGRPPRRIGHNLLLRFFGHKEDVLRFLTDPRVPFTNNLAEQAARMMKLRQKISGGFRSAQGANDFALIRSVLSTARKQGWDILATLSADPDRLTAQLCVG